MKKKISYGALAFGVFLLFSVTMVTRSILAGPQTVPTEKDVTKAEREAKPKSGADERTQVPEGALVAGNGIIEPADRETKLASHIPGRIKAVLVKEGDDVAQGAPVAELENEAEKSALEAAEADLSVRRAELMRTARGLRKEDRDAIVADTEGAKARSELSQGALDRVTVASKGGAVTADELDRAKRQADADKSALSSAESRRAAALSGARSEDVFVAQANVQAAIARRDQAKSTFDRLTIRSPIAGKILQVKLRAGEYYNPQGGDPIAVVGDTRKLRVRMDLDERDLGKVKEGAKAFVTLNAYPGKKFAARVVELGRRMGRKNVRTDDPTERIDTKILEVLLELDDRDGLVPGLRVVSYVEIAGK
jgi:HlyD family secretion protein